MYIAKMPEGMAEANYFYKNTSIYFNEHISDEDLEEFAIHECIHYIQEIKDKRNYLLRMGLCDYTEFKIYGLGLNEASVQLMASKVLSIPKEYVKYFNITFETNSPSYYPLECCLVNQLAYLVGEDILFESTINSNDNFKNKLIECIGYKNFMTIQNNIDKLLMSEEEIIVSGYFDKAFLGICDLESVEKYRRKLYNFKDYLGSTDGYTFFNDFYVNKMMDLEDKYYLLENNVSSTSIYMVKKKTSKILSFFRYIRSLFTARNLNDYDNEFENTKNK